MELKIIFMDLNLIDIMRGSYNGFPMFGLSINIGRDIYPELKRGFIFMNETVRQGVYLGSLYLFA